MFQRRYGNHWSQNGLYLKVQTHAPLVGIDQTSRKDLANQSLNSESRSELEISNYKAAGKVRSKQVYTRQRLASPYSSTTPYRSDDQKQTALATPHTKKIRKWELLRPPLERVTRIFLLLQTTRVTTTRACKGERQGRVCRKNTGHRHTGQDENESGERGRKNYIKHFFKKIIEKSANTYARLLSSQYRGSRAPCVCLRTKAATSTRERERRDGDESARKERERERERERESAREERSIAIAENGAHRSFATFLPPVRRKSTEFSLSQFQLWFFQ